MLDQGNLFLSFNRPDAAATAFRAAQELRPDLRSYQGDHTVFCHVWDSYVILLTIERLLQA